MEALHARLIDHGGLARKAHGGPGRAVANLAADQISPLTKAIGYMLDHWVGLTRFLADGRLEPDTNIADGRLEPDTNIVERPIRPIAIGRRNSLFAGDEGGGATTNDRLRELLAWHWKAAREAQAAKAAA
jgi:hypothetical protein